MVVLLKKAATSVAEQGSDVKVHVCAEKNNSASGCTKPTLIPYTLPEFLQLQEVQELTIEFGPPPWDEDPRYDPKSAIAQIALWDWEQQEWIEQPATASQHALNLTGADAQRFFDIEQGVHLQITSQSPGGTYVNIVVTVEGTW